MEFLNPVTDYMDNSLTIRDVALMTGELVQYAG